MKKTGLLFIIINVLLVVLVMAGCSQPAPTSTPSLTPTSAPAPTSAPSPKPSPAPSAAPSPTATAITKPITLKTIVYQPVPDSSNAPYKWFIDTVNERAKGKINIQLLGGPEIIPANAQPEAVRLGVVDMACGSPTAYEQMLLGFSNALIVSRLSGTAERQSGFYDYALKQHMEKLNSYYLGKLVWSPNKGGIYYIFSNIKMTKPEDLKGKKIRSVALFNPFLQALGVAPVTMAFAEVYSALQTRVVDGGVTTMLAAANSKWYEVTKFGIDHPFLSGGSTMLVNMDVWKSLPKDMQDLLIQAGKEAEIWGSDNYDQLENEAKQTVIKGGVQFNTFTPEEVKTFVDLAYEAGWQKVKSVVPSAEYETLRKLLVK